MGVELLLRPLLDRLGITTTSTPAYERNYRAVLKGEGGQSDAVYGHAVIEYEPPGSLRTARGVKHAQEQLERYLKAEATRSVAKREDVLRRSVGIGLDGGRIFFVRYRGKGSDRSRTRTRCCWRRRFPSCRCPRHWACFAAKGLTT